MTTAEGCVWLQREISIPAKKRGCHLISDEFTRLVPEIEQIKIGLANVHSKIFLIQIYKLTKLKRVSHTSISYPMKNCWLVCRYTMGGTKCTRKLCFRVCFSPTHRVSSY